MVVDGLISGGFDGLIGTRWWWMGRFVRGFDLVLVSYGFDGLIGLDFFIWV